MIDIEIDGKLLKAPQGSMIIEVADDNGISIPRFCYHKKLSVAANCRMCLVEVEKVGKPLPACATPVTPNMKVFTQSAKARDAQRAVMEFLLINHPLDCPICDQGGQCELQDNALLYGRDDSLFDEGKRVVADKDIGPLIATDLTRCIQCTRCVRFGQEIAGIRELGALGRGENMHIGTFVEKSLSSEISGNIIDLCPVGALTSKPYRFTARPWELTQHDSISPHDCYGTNLYVHTRNGSVMRVVPKENDAINETWLSDRERYSYTGLASPERLLNPSIKINGQWHDADWSTALAEVARQLNVAKTAHGPDAIAALASPISTSEELYLLAKIADHLGLSQFDYRPKTQDQRDEAIVNRYLMTDCSIKALEDCQVALVIGANLPQELPLAATRLRKAALQGAQVHAINPAAYAFHFPLTSMTTCSLEQSLVELKGIIKAVLDQSTDGSTDEFQAHFAATSSSPQQQQIATDLLTPTVCTKVVFLGQLAYHHPAAAELRALALLLCRFTQAQYFFSTDGANTTGGDIAQQLSLGRFKPYAAWQAAKAYLLLNLEPALDCADSTRFLSHLAQADSVIMMSAFDSPALREQATILLPTACFSETSGSFVNIEGVWQSFNASVNAPGDSRPGWKILRVLGNLLDIYGFDYVSSTDVSFEIQQSLQHKPLTALKASTAQLLALLQLEQPLPPSCDTLALFSDWTIYSVDNLVRRALPLQQAPAQAAFGLYVNAKTAERWALFATEWASLLHLDDRIPDNRGFVPAGHPETAALLATLFSLPKVITTHD